MIGRLRSADRSLLLPPPDDDHARGVGGRQQTLVAVEADIQHRPPVTLQLVHYGLGVPLHVEEVDAAVLAASHCVRGEEIRGSTIDTDPSVPDGRQQRSILRLFLRT